MSVGSIIAGIGAIIVGSILFFSPSLISKLFSLLIIFIGFYILFNKSEDLVKSKKSSKKATKRKKRKR